VQLIHTLFEPNGNGPHPTILALHGWGASALDLLGLAPYICAGRFLVICPQGPLEVPIGAGAAGYGWFPLRMNGPTDLAAILTAQEQLRTFLDDMLARYPIDRTKLVVLGFSQGGAMAYSLALSQPQRFSGLIVLSSWFSQELVQGLSIRATAPFPSTLVQHGARDELIVVDRARESVELLRNLRVPVTYREYDMGHEISPRSLADLSSWLDEKVLSPIIVT
jgi:phospholipase/carboxylesterase